MSKQVIFYIPRLTIGGAERVTLDLLNSFSKDNDFEVILITDIKESYLINQVPQNIKCHNLMLNNSFLSKIREISKILKNYTNGIILSHIHHCHTHMVLANTLFFSNKLKIVAVEHSLTSHYLRTFPTIKNKILLKIIPYLYRKLHSIICVSNGVKNDLVTNLKIPKEKCFVIYNPLNYKRIEELKDEALDESVQKIFNNKNVIVCIGRLSKEKNQILLLQAFNLLYEMRQDISLVFIGEGVDKPNLESYVEQNNLKNKVHFLGRKSNPYNYLAKAKVLALPSIEEGFGLVLIEAIFLKTQVAAVSSTTSREILSNYQQCLSDSSPIKLSEKINDLLSGPVDFKDEKITPQYQLEHIYLQYKSHLSEVLMQTSQ